MASPATHLSLIFVLFVYISPPTPAAAKCNFCVVQGYGGVPRCFLKRDWCDSTRDCPDGRDEWSCKTGYPHCGDQLASCGFGKCIPKYWICDGEVDCPDGYDENCDSQGRPRSLFAAEEDKFRQWMLDQRSKSWGWGKDTPRAIVAMYLMNTTEYSSGDPNSALAAKELETQLSVDLFKSPTLPLEGVKMAQYIQAMLATCSDPKHFHGIDLVAALHEKVSKLKTIRPFTLLALCNAGRPIPRRYIEKLKNIITRPSDPFWIDTKALATMALTCAMSSTGDRTLNSTILNSLLKMKSLQREDGSFGDAKTTAVIMQALISNNYNGWDFRKALQYIAYQRRNDSRGMLTNYLMPVLSKRSLLDLRNVNCSYKDREGLRNITTREILEQKAGERIYVRYSIQIGDRKDVSHSSTFRVPVNTSLFDVMKLAGDTDKRYSFQWRESNGRKYIDSMSSIDNDPELRKYWSLYKMTDGERLESVQQDMDDVYPKNGEHYVFWYKTVSEDELDEGVLERNTTVADL